MVWSLVFLLLACLSSSSAKYACPCDGQPGTNLTELRLIEIRLERLEVTFQKMGFNSTLQPIQDIWYKVDMLYRNYETLTTTDRQQQYNVIHREFQKVSVNIDSVSAGWDTSLDELKKELEDLWAFFDTIIKSNDEYDLIRCMENVKDLQEQLDDLRNDDGEVINGFDTFRGDKLPLQPITDGWCRDRNIAKFAYPVAHRFVSLTYMDFWYKDPLPQSTDSRTAVFFKQNNIRTAEKYYIYNTYKDFVVDNAEGKQLVLTSSLASTNDGFPNDFIVYRERIIHSVGHRTLKAWYLDGRKGEQTITIPANLNTAPLYYRGAGSWGSPKVDIHVDEYGIYLVYANSARRNRLSISLLNETSLLPVETWHTAVLKESVCAAFMMCGKLYTLENCNRRIVDETMYDYVFDTRTGENGFVPATLVGFGTKIDRFSYNPREQLVFGWDTGYALTYPIIWK